MRSTQQQARRAGMLYVMLAVTAPIGLLYVPGKLFVRGDAAATADNLRAAEWLLRLGIASELVHQVIFVFVVLALYRLLKTVDEHQARLMVIFGVLLSVPIVFVNVLNEIAALMLISGAEYLSVFGQAELDALAYLFIGLHGQGISVATIFWGLWLFPFGLLVLRSSFIPRALGVLLLIAGVANVVDALTALITPHYDPVISQITSPLEALELPIVFWLVIWGAKAPPAVEV